MTYAVGLQEVVLAGQIVPEKKLATVIHQVSVGNFRLEGRQLNSFFLDCGSKEVDCAVISAV